MDPFTISLLVGAATSAAGIGAGIFGSNQKENADAKLFKQAAVANAITTGQTNSLLRDAAVAAMVAGAIYAAWSLAVRI